MNFWNYKAHKSKIFPVVLALACFGTIDFIANISASASASEAPSTGKTTTEEVVDDNPIATDRAVPEVESPAYPQNSHNTPKTPPVPQIQVTPPVPTSVTPTADEINLVVRLKAKRVFVYRGDKELYSFPVAIGKKGWETPKGSFRVFSMEVNPIFKSFKTGQYIQPGPRNPLGPRWIGIWTDGKTQLGFHGTNQPELIGKPVSHGCIRMHNKDVVTLYEKVKIGTLVRIE